MTTLQEYRCEAHAQVCIGRRFESICSPPKPDFMTPKSVQPQRVLVPSGLTNSFSHRHLPECIATNW